MLFILFKKYLNEVLRCVANFILKCEISDRMIGNGFKFHDYFSSFGTDREVFDLRSGKMPDVEKDFKCNFNTIEQVYEKQNELIECFPFQF